MERSDEEQAGTCVECGAETRPGLEGAFTFGASGVLCPSCAAGRGGVYDAERDAWTREPDYGDFAREFDETPS